MSNILEVGIKTPNVYPMVFIRPYCLKAQYDALQIAYRCLLDNVLIDKKVRIINNGKKSQRITFWRSEMKDRS